MASTKKYTNEELYDWFVGKAKTAAGIRQRVLTIPEKAKSGTVIGRLFFFSYDPKLKKILPIYDRYPLVFPIESYADGFLGLNIHYLDIGSRKRLFELLVKYGSNKMITERTKLSLSYDLLKSTKQLSNAARPCIKRYLYNHVRSQFIEITPNEWDVAAELPLELWVTKK